MTTIIEEALTIALKAHDGQRRKGTQIPYISHPIGVCSLVMEHGGDLEQAAAAILHDAIEDGGAEYGPIIRDRLGQRVHAIVLACTDGEAGSKGDWWERKRHYLAGLPNKPVEALLVCACDKLHNARAIVADKREIGAQIFERFKAGRDGTLWYYGELSRIIATAPLPTRLQREIGAAVEEMRQ